MHTLPLHLGRRGAPQLLAFAAILVVDWLVSPQFFDLRMQGGRLFGSLIDVFNRGANNVWEIRKGDKEYLMPDIPGIVVSVDIEKEVALVRPIPGIFDDAEEVR